MPKVKKEIAVEAPVDIVYAAWHNFENFPNFMSNIEEVRVVSPDRSHWKAKGPLGTAAEWDAEITMDKPNEAIGWRSIEGESSVKTAGRVNFREAGSATNLDVTIEYESPGGLVGDVVTKIFANPEQQVEEDLARFKDLIESGAQMAGLDRDTSGETYGGSMSASQRDLDEIAAQNDPSLAPGGSSDATRGEVI